MYLFHKCILCILCIARWPTLKGHTLHGFWWRTCWCHLWYINPNIFRRTCLTPWYIIPNIWEFSLYDGKYLAMHSNTMRSDEKQSNAKIYHRKYRGRTQLRLRGKSTPGKHLISDISASLSLQRGCYEVIGCPSTASSQSMPSSWWRWWFRLSCEFMRGR